MDKGDRGKPEVGRSRAGFVGAGMGAGIATGVVLGRAMHNMGAGIAIGIVTGAGIGVALVQSARQDSGSGPK